ncbi:MAG: hypothetical protein ACREBS_05195 [Nitrososphaerales archaeon]
MTNVQRKPTIVAIMAIALSAMLLTMSWSIVSAKVAKINISEKESKQVPEYIMVGGQSGSWFTTTQHPELYKVGLGTGRGKWTTLETVSGAGSVWSGGWNGSDWLVTGWGWGDEQGLNPYMNVFDSSGTTQLFFSNYSESSSAEQEWAGGDMFSATWNGSIWLLTGMGSGYLAGYGSTNHLSMGFLTANGTFIDLSGQIPDQQDGILYASSWNGQYWLVGGGWYGFDTGVLYMVSQGGAVTNLAALIQSGVPTFDSVQTIAWNGEYWLIGGVGFLAEYNPTTSAVYDMTSKLNLVLGANDSLSASLDNAVNSIAWTGNYWMLGGGVPVGHAGGTNSTAWVASYDPSADSASSEFKNLEIIPGADVSSDEMSSILSMSCLGTGCAIGGFSNEKPILIWYNGNTSTDISGSIPAANMTYAQWVGIG